MGFTLMPAGSGSPADPLSLPNAVSIVCSDDGGGGTLFINGLGFSSAGTYDLKTFFGAAAFKSYPLLNAFRRILTENATVAEQQLIRALRISICPLAVGASPEVMPGIDYTFTSDATTIAPVIAVYGPGAAGFWRIEIELRHSVTN